MVYSFPVLSRNDLDNQIRDCRAKRESVIAVGHLMICVTFSAAQQLILRHPPRRTRSMSAGLADEVSYEGDVYRKAPCARGLTAFCTWPSCWQRLRQGGTREHSVRRGLVLWLSELR